MPRARKVDASSIEIQKSSNIGTGLLWPDAPITVAGALTRLEAIFLSVWLLQA
jgi:hypothetical protein